MTEEQFVKWQEKNCVRCSNCPFAHVSCGDIEGLCWIDNKDLYSDKFLDQEIEIEDEPILTKKEKEYLRAVIKPFRKRVVGIAKVSYRTLGEKIVIMFGNLESFTLPFFKAGTMYKRMKLDTPYTLEELGL